MPHAGIYFLKRDALIALRSKVSDITYRKNVKTQVPCGETEPFRDDLILALELKVRQRVYIT